MLEELECCFKISSIRVAGDISGALCDSFYCLFKVQTQGISQPDLMHLSVFKSSTVGFLVIS